MKIWFGCAMTAQNRIKSIHLTIFGVEIFTAAKTGKCFGYCSPGVYSVTSRSTISGLSPDERTVSPAAIAARDILFKLSHSLATAMVVVPSPVPVNVNGAIQPAADNCGDVPGRRDRQLYTVKRKTTSTPATTEKGICTTTTLCEKKGKIRGRKEKEGVMITDDKNKVTCRLVESRLTHHRSRKDLACRCPPVKPD